MNPGFTLVVDVTCWLVNISILGRFRHILQGLAKRKKFRFEAIHHLPLIIYDDSRPILGGPGSTRHLSCQSKEIGWRSANLHQHFLNLVLRVKRATGMHFIDCKPRACTHCRLFKLEHFAEWPPCGGGWPPCGSSWFQRQKSLAAAPAIIHISVSGTSPFYHRISSSRKVSCKKKISFTYPPHF